MPERAQTGRWQPLAAGVFAWLVLCAPVLAPGMQLGDRDTGRLYYPVKKFVAESIRRGESPFWYPAAEGGVSLIGQVTPGIFHPSTLLYLLPFDLAFALNHLLALFIGGIGVYWLARLLSASRWAALAGALAFGGSGALVSAASSNLPYALGPSSVPLAVAGLFWFAEHPSAARLLCSSALLASCAAAGDPQSFGVAILVGAAWLAVRSRLSGLKRAALWSACGILLSLPVAVPAALQLQRSARGQGMSARETVSFSTVPIRLVGLLVPRAFDQQETAEGKRGDTFSEFLSGASGASFLASICLGAAALLLALTAGGRATFALAAAALFLLAATGEALGVQALLSAVVPGWKYFRFAEKLVLPATWLLAVAAAIGLERAAAGGARRLARASLGLGCASLLAAAIAWLARGPLAGVLQSVGRSHDPGLALRMLELFTRGACEVAGLSLAVFLAARSRRLLLPVAAIACAAPALLEPMLVPVDARLFQGRSSTGEKAIEVAGPSPSRWRLWVDAGGPLFTPGESSMEPHAARLLAGREALLPQLQALDGIDGLAPYFSAPDARFLAALQGAHEQVFALFGVRLEVLRDREPRPGLPQSESGYFLRELPAQPRAFVVHRARPAGSIEEAVAALRGLDVHAEALVDGEAIQEAEAAASVRLDRPAANAFSAGIESPNAGLLIVGERFDPGWSARVDGAEAPVVEADLAAIGVRVPAGRHRVELRFFPRGLGFALAVAGFTVLVLLGLALRSRWVGPSAGRSGVPRRPSSDAPRGASRGQREGVGRSSPP